MRLPIVHPGRIDEAAADRLLAEGRTQEPTYPGAGALLAGTVQPDFEVCRRIGSGEAVFAAVTDALQRMVPQDEVFTVWPRGAQADAGSTLLVVLGLGPVSLVAVNRIVGVVDEPDRWAYAYGTLPGHPESGEEVFAVERGSDGGVVARIATRARVAVPAGRLLHRLSVPIQRRAAERYLDVLERAVEV